MTAGNQAAASPSGWMGALQVNWLATPHNPRACPVPARWCPSLSLHLTGIDTHNLSETSLSPLSIDTHPSGFNSLAREGRRIAYFKQSWICSVLAADSDQV